MKLTVILPAYNEEATIGPILDAVLGVTFPGLADPVEMEVIAVDDASTDRTAEIIARYPRVKLLRHARNLGKGAAIRTALKEATGDVALIQDADMEYSVQDYPALLRPFIEQGAEVVFGSRFLRRRWPRNMTVMAWIANKALTLTANVLYGMRITDEATCFKLMRMPLIRSLPLRARGFDFCPEVTALVRLRKVRIHEVPIEYKARTRDEGKKIRWTHGVQAMKTLFAYRFSRQ